MKTKRRPRGSGSLYQKRGWYYLKFTAAGQTITEAAKTQDKTEAERLLHIRLGEVASGTYIPPNRLTVAMLATRLEQDYLRIIASLCPPCVPHNFCLLHWLADPEQNIPLNLGPR